MTTNNKLYKTKRIRDHCKKLITEKPHYKI